MPTIFSLRASRNRPSPVNAATAALLALPQKEWCNFACLECTPVDGREPDPVAKLDFMVRQCAYACNYCEQGIFKRLADMSVDEAVDFMAALSRRLRLTSPAYDLVKFIDEDLLCGH